MDSATDQVCGRLWHAGYASNCIDAIATVKFKVVRLQKEAAGLIAKPPVPLFGPGCTSAALLCVASVAILMDEVAHASVAPAPLVTTSSAHLAADCT